MTPVRQDEGMDDGMRLPCYVPLMMTAMSDEGCVMGGRHNPTHVLQTHYPIPGFPNLSLKDAKHRCA